MIQPPPAEPHVSHPPVTKRRPVVISTDCGIDDAQALAIALRSTAIHILAICCTHGNVPLPSVVANVCAVLQAAGRDDIPVFRGSEVPLVDKLEEMAEFWHGEDGLGNTNHGSRANKDCVRSDMSSSEAIIHYAKQHWEKHEAGEADRLTIITLGPLTDLAMAVRIEPKLSEYVDTVFIMGGAPSGHGNVGFPGGLAAEYNIHSDPEAAQIVFAASSFPRLVMVSWELTLKYGLKPDFLSQYLGSESKLGKFVAEVSRHLVEVSGEDYIKEKGLMIPDPLAMMIAIDPTIITDSARHAVFIETRGKYTRGMTVTDFSDLSKKPRNCEVVWSIDFERVKKMLLDSVA
jgi:purine nucleosidase